MIDQIQFLFSEAMIGMRRNLLMTVAGIATVAASLFLIGTFGYLYFRVERFSSGLPASMEVQLFMKDNESVLQLQAFRKKLQTDPSVASVEFVSKERAWAKMKAENPDIPAELDNTLPDSFKITFASLKQAEAGAQQYTNDPEVEKVIYEKDLLNAFQHILGLIRYLGWLGLGLLSIGGIIVYNAIQLALLSRTKEMRIMSLVGATAATIKLPFMLEGLIQGLSGGVLALGLMAFVNHQVQARVAEFGWNLPAFPLGAILLILVGCGAGLGVLCSAIALRRPARVRA